MSVLDRKNSDVSAEKPSEPLTNKQLTEAVETLTTGAEKAAGRDQAQSIWLTIVTVLALVLVAVVIYTARHQPKPAPLPPTTPASVMARLDSVIAASAAKDSLLAQSGRRLTKLETMVKDQTTMIESYGGRVDDVQYTLNRLDLSGLAKRK